MDFGLKRKTHKIIAFMIVLAMALSLLGIGDVVTYAFEKKDGMVHMNSTSALLQTYESASTSSEGVSKLVYGKPVTVIDETTDSNGEKWYKVTYLIQNGAVEKTAYCQAEHILLNENAFVIGTGKTNANNVSLWSCTGSYQKPEIARVNAGTKVEILDEITDSGASWLRVRCKVKDVTYHGWIQRGYVTKDAIPEIETDEEYEDYLVRIGFPKSYVKGLAVLHEQYPNWVFEPIKTGLTWDEVIENESKAGRNLIQTSRNDAMKSYAGSEYNWYTNEWVIRDSSSWVTTHPDYIKYCMDPRNWFNATNIFMFESLSYSETHKIDGVNAILSGTFMTKEIDNGDGTMLNYATAFMDIAKAVNVSPYHLASRVRQEQGVNGTSPLISGKYSGYEGYYNYFNHGAYGTGSSVFTNGLTYAKNKGWNTRYKSLYGGSEIIAKNYISVGQDTLYFQKFDVIAQGGLYTHQYMTNVEASISESKSVAKAYTDKQQMFVFKIPVYENMPSEPAQFTASGNRNNYLKSLEVKGHSLTPTFDGAKTSYSLIVENKVSSITVSATPVVGKASVQGTGTLSLKEGTNTFSIICKSESGDKKTYTLTVIREKKEETPPSDVPSETPDVTPKHTYSSAKYVLGTYITGVEPQTKVTDFLAGFKAENCSLKVLTSAGVENTGTVATGNKLGVYVNDKLVESKEIVIYGDANGDGVVDVYDIIRINRHALNISRLKGAFLEAGDANRKGDGADVLDIIIANRHTLGLSTINQK